ncbi:seven-hairpin glycosidase [Artomyces pyxidatus]|uniref:Seven-hairpin glycosidase n=1 Tax=Artomyces pyxidatus TaxID=48021 RepID=A0ACB8SW40_9AGAM|nr:seven-hairpin glycosidase [Artomyces pyxidatus]
MAVAFNTLPHHISSLAHRPLARLVALVIVLIFLSYFFLPFSALQSQYTTVPEPFHDRTSFFNRPLNERPQRHGHFRPPPLKHSHAADKLWAGRAEQVKGAFLHAYDAYRENAVGHDEVLPLSNRSIDNFNGWGLTVVESLDTMWLMGLQTEFDEALSIVSNMTFSLEPTRFAPFFETVIRYLGGLLSAYALSADPIFLARADDLGSMLLPALDTHSGLPMYAINTVSGKTQYGWAAGTTLWAEALSCQLEYKYLAYLTGRKSYYTKVQDIMTLMYAANLTSTQGLFPTLWDTAHGTPRTTSVSVGAFADSAYEYMLKQWLLTGRTDAQARDLYVRSANAILDNLLFVTHTRGLLYVTDTTAPHVPTHIFEHLSCFLPGVLALGASTLPESSLSDAQRERHLFAARGLAQTCWALYNDAQTGLAPDEVQMHVPSGASAARWGDLMHEWEKAGRPGLAPGTGDPAQVRQESAREYSPRKRAWLLRPEAVESFYILWRVTGEVRWREHGWAVFQAVERAARVEGGYASVENVDVVGGKGRDEMPSYFLAETLKYLYMLFTDSELIPLDKWVFNTEAHPLPVFEWTDWERETYGIPSPSS